MRVPQQKRHLFRFDSTTLIHVSTILFLRGFLSGLFEPSQIHQTHGKSYLDYFDAYALGREYLIGDAFLAKYRNISRDFIWQEQNERFKRLLARAWRMAFYRRLWGEHGVKPGDIRSLLDLEKLPVFDATYLLAAQADPALFGDISGQDSYPSGGAPPLVEQFFGPRGAAIKRQLGARVAALQGASPDHQRYEIANAGLIAAGADRNGLYLMEDAHYLEILAPVTQLTLAEGTAGELVLTTLFKDDLGPLIRFNTHDIGAICSSESRLGLNLRRIQRL